MTEIESRAVIGVAYQVGGVPSTSYLYNDWTGSVTTSALSGPIQVPLDLILTDRGVSTLIGDVERSRHPPTKAGPDPTLEEIQSVDGGDPNAIPRPRTGGALPCSRVS